jgi:hypothetical protein
MFASETRRLFFARAQLGEERLRDLPFAGIHAALEKAQNYRCIARGVGLLGRALDAPQKLGGGLELGDVLKQGSKAPAGGTNRVQSFLGWFRDETPAGIFQRAPFLGNSRS